VSGDIASISLGSTNSSLAQLAQRLGVQWNQLAAASARTRNKKSELSRALAGLDSADTSIVAFGSLARNEFTQGSDIDWTLLIDGQAASEHLAIANKFGMRLQNLKEKSLAEKGSLASFPLAMTSFIRSGVKTTPTRIPRSASSYFWSRVCSASRTPTTG
jgi:predicted nucleotidyltransferase